MGKRGVKAKDLMGQRFGMLTVIKYSGNRKWLCRCDCGNEKEIFAQNFKSGRTTNCGCVFKKESFVDLTGQRFGKLIVLGISNKNEYTWLCKCDCGGEKIVHGDNLKKGSTNSCGCLRINDLTGKRFGKLKVIERKDVNKCGNYRWLCLCDCGKEVIVNGTALTSGQTTSCGCLYRGENHHFWKGGITPIKTYLRNVVDSSGWGIKCRELVDFKCQLTGQTATKEDDWQLHVHHLYSFNNIVIDAHVVNGINIKSQINDYTKEELAILTSYVKLWHNNCCNAMVLRKTVHELFHKEYGLGDNTPEQFEEFKQRYLNGEFDDVLGSN